MSQALTEVDKMLLGEAGHPEQNGVDQDELIDEAAAEALTSIKFTPFNADTSARTEPTHNGSAIIKNEMTDEMDEDTMKTPTKKSPNKKRGMAASAADEETTPSPAKKRSPTKKSTANADANIDEPKTPTKKKRAAPKKKANATADNVENAAEDGAAPEPVTPQKKRSPTKAKAANAKNGSKGKETVEDPNATETEDDASNESPVKAKGEANNNGGTPRKRQAPKNSTAAPRGIPNSYEEADHADRMLVMMKEEGKDWASIREAWKTVTGQETATSTLPNRYNRIKVNMMRLKDGDDILLLTAKVDIERAHENEKWAKIATAMESRGADKYPTAFLQKMFKQLESQAAAANANANGSGNGSDVKEEEDDDSMGESSGA